MQTALAHNLCLAARPTAARVVGGRRVPALRSASTTRCQAATVSTDLVLAPCAVPSSKQVHRRKSHAAAANFSDAACTDAA
jgi:hypothetical protein